MKMCKTTVKVYLALILVLLFGCTKELDIDYPAKDSKMVLNAVIYEGEPIRVNITHTLLYDNAKAFEAVPDAKVNLYKNNEFIEELVYTDKGFFIGNHKPTKGSTYELKVEHDVYTNVSAKTTIPNELAINIIKYTVDTTDIFNPKIHIEVQFNDDESTKDFYRIHAWHSVQNYNYDYSYDDNGYTEIKTIGDTTKQNIPIVTENALFKAVLNTFTDGNYAYYNSEPFSDEEFNGTSVNFDFTLSDFNDQFRYDAVDDTIHLDFFNYSKEYVEYITDYMNQSNSDDFFSEPVFMYSNVEGGVGIFASATKQNFTFTKPKIYNPYNNDEPFYILKE